MYGAWKCCIESPLSLYSSLFSIPQSLPRWYSYTFSILRCTKCCICSPLNLCTLNPSNHLGGKLPSPPLHPGVVCSVVVLAHWTGVLAEIDNAWTGPSNSFSRALLTKRCLAINLWSSNTDDTTVTLKCVSEPVGTLCLKDSLTTSRWSGENAAVNFWMMEVSTVVVAIVRMLADRKVLEMFESIHSRSLVHVLVWELCTCVGNVGNVGRIKCHA